MSDRVDPAPNGSHTAHRRATILPLDRSDSFSDGVFSIAITLLVLEIAVPPVSTPLGPALLALWPDFLGYFVSFFYIGGFWLAHSGLTKFMKQGDTMAYGLNLLTLLFIALLPFVTRLMVTHVAGPDMEMATVIYGLNVLVSALMLSSLMIYVARQPRLLVDDLAEDSIKRLYRQRWISIGACAFAVVIAFVAPNVAVALYLVVAALFLVLPLLGMHQARRSAGR